MKRYAVLAAVALVGVSAAQTSRIGIKPPKLVVAISIDQFRDDYIPRYYNYFLPAKSGGKLGGFRFLTDTGAWYKDAHHNHVPTATGPGHATLLSGSEPAVDGIVGNDWYDRAAGHAMYCVEDRSVETVGGTSGPMSPRNLKVTTIGDELKMATNGRSRVVSLALKDRAAILMSGHASDGVVWFDNNTGNWVTSTWYAPNKQLPAWAQKINADRLVDKGYGTSWEPMLPADAYSITRRTPSEKPADNGKVFSHPLGSGGKPDKAYWGAMWTSAWGNEFTVQSAMRAVESEQLGKHDVPDLLTLSLSSNDYVGHRFGPNSPEAMDATVATDRALSELFNALDKQVGIDNVVIVLSADHGVLPVPEEATNSYKSPDTRFPGNFKAAIQKALTEKFGPGDWVLGEGMYEQNFYINRETAKAKNLKMEDVENAVAEAALAVPGAFAAFTRTQLLKGDLPKWDWVSRAMNGFSPTLGGDLMIFEAPGVLFGGSSGTGHGSTWEYDSHVPIIVRGGGVTKGIFNRRVATADIAPTLSLLLGIEYPSGNQGKPLVEALGASK